MKNLHNVEKSGFHRGEYVGYSKYGVWRIVKYGAEWRANLKTGQIVTNLPFAPVLTENTLFAMSKKLENF